MKLFLTSEVGASQKINGTRIATKMNNTNKFVDELKSSLSLRHKFVFLPSRGDGGQITEMYFNLTVQSFDMSGLSFNEYVLIDNRNADKAAEIIKDADLLFLSGGHTLTQINFFKSLNITKTLNNFKGIIVGQSAGAMNLADIVYCSPESDEEINDVRYFAGLGLTNISIEPHFKNSPHQLAGIDLIKDILLPDSCKRPFIAITDGSYIVDNGITQTIYGEAYLFKDGDYQQICENGKTKIL